MNGSIGVLILMTVFGPHLKFGQGIPGITEGRGIGIIERAARRICSMAGRRRGTRPIRKASSSGCVPF